MNAYSLNGRLYEWLVAALTRGRVNALKKEMMPRLEIEPGERILDWGCGAGAAQRIAVPYLAGRGHVCGVDVSPSLVKRAEAQAPASDELLFTFIVREGFDLELDEPADIALACHSLGVVPPEQIDAAVDEIWRNLRPGARILVTDMVAPPQTSWLKARIQAAKMLLAQHVFGQRFLDHVLPAVERCFQQQELVEREDIMALAYIGVRRDVPLATQALQKTAVPAHDA